MMEIGLALLVNPIKLELIKENKLYLEEYYILYCKYFNKTSWIEIYKPSNIYYSRLRRHKYIDINSELTSNGVQLCKALFIEDTSQIDKDFEEFWQAYPADDKWGNFSPTRRIRVNKVKARLLYGDIRKTVHQQTLLEGLRNEIAIRKKNSVRENNMKYMQNVCTWLNNKTYESFVTATKEESTEYGKNLN